MAAKLAVMSDGYVPTDNIPLGVYVVVQVPPALSVQVAGLKLPATPPFTPKVTTPPVTTPAEPLSVAVTVMPVVEPAGALTALTVAVVGDTALIDNVLLPLAAT